MGKCRRKVEKGEKKEINKEKKTTRKKETLKQKKEEKPISKISLFPFSCSPLYRKKASFFVVHPKGSKVTNKGGLR